MKKIIISAISLLIATGCMASKAIQQPFDVSQPDGTTLAVRLIGDYDFHWYETIDGALLYPLNGSFYIAETAFDGTLYPSKQLAHNRKFRSAEELTVIGKQSVELFFEAVKRNEEQRVLRQPTIGSNHYCPHTGKTKVVVILAEYTDTKFTLPDPKRSFDLMFNSMEELEDLGNGEHRNHGSIRQYFIDMSFEAFQPEFQIVGPVSLPNEMKYYGGTSANGNDEKSSAMVSDALALVEDQIDFTQPDYDLDNDGRIDAVIIVYAGYGQNSGGPVESVWARANSSSAVVDGKQLGRFCMASELNLNEAYWSNRDLAPQINGVGVFCHEFSHTMGLPDLYPTTSTAYLDNQEMEYWDLMDGGEYVNNGYRPTAYTAWEREAMGWMTIEELNNQNMHLNISPVLEGGKAYKMVNPESDTEYMVLENIQKRGWNTSLPGHGLLVYHVNYPSGVVNMGDRPNNTPHKPNVAIVPADGILASSYLIGNETSWGTGVKEDDDGNIISNNIATRTDYFNSHYGDPFPGSQGIIQLSYSQNLPNYEWYQEEKTVLCSLFDIQENEQDGTISLLYSSNGTDIESHRTRHEYAATGGFYTVNGVSATDKRLQGDIIIHRGKKYRISR